MNNNYIDLSFIPNELKLLLKLMHAENSDNIDSYNNELNELCRDIDWDEFLRLVIHHRVYPLIYSRLKKIDEELIPSKVIQTLYQEYKMNTFQMLNLSAEMEQVSKLFTENKIHLLFLKGPVIAADIYGDISLRTSKDLDILIQKKDLKTAEVLLLNCGYVKEETPTLNDVWKWRDHHISYFNPIKRIQIELHWRLNPYPMKEPCFNELWERKRISMLTSYPVYFFGKEDLFLYLVAHGSKHGWFRLRWLADINQILRNGISEKNNTILLNLQHQYLGQQASLLTGQALILTSLLLNAPVYEEWKSLTTEKRSMKVAQLAVYYIVEMGNVYNDKSKSALNKDKMLNPSIISSLQKTMIFIRYPFSIKSNLERLIFLMKLLSPNKEDAKTLWLPKPLRFLYFPLHPLLWIWRKARKTT